MQMLVDLKPGFLRLPGGNALEGDSIEKRFDWKKTVGPLEGRPGHQGPWGYRSTDGMGLLEYLQWAEDMGAEPLLAVYAGYSLNHTHVNPGPDLDPYVQDALDEIEYVTGSTDTKWGAQRAKDGHPAPFPLHYVEIGNEDWFDGSGSYIGRFTQIRNAIKAKYPNLLCISSIGNEHRADQRPTAPLPDLVDEHYYKAAKDFEAMAPTYYDNYPRTGPAIFVGEWAAYEDIIPWDPRSAPLPRTPSMKSALADACWMAGLERNADIVQLQCYAPLLVNESPGASQWRPNLIGYNALHVYGSPSYYAIKMFNLHRGDTILKGRLEGAGARPAVQYSVTKDSHKGMIYLKLVNPGAAPQSVNVNLQGVNSITQPADVETLSAGSMADTNSMAEPTKIVPVDSKLQAIQPAFTYTIPPYSITVLQMHAL
jgi:alpha-N-arabinofuranosidase